ncbi:LacI family DNA-binding transcriptional regulator [Chishuiella sp.]|uniref:LacI family DNA-binding transcriptional regulator n=1 Tax=Chishuiella sp. TaxID=1969467 RepID=UPI0028B0E05C|nr:LacI family DNA-binding transcriptional regulator [Chishuiella sp.]
MKKNITIYDLSEKLNISAATVSRALNNHPKISQKTKELVLKTAKELNYKQNSLAQALKSGKTNNVGVIVPYINSNFFSSVIRGIEEELTPHGYHVIICQSHEDIDLEKKHLNTLLNAQVDGIFMSVSKTTDEVTHIENAKSTNTPILFFDRKKDISGISTVVIDDYKAGYLATEHLIEQGCKRISHLSGDLRLEIYQNRYNGYVQALKDYGITFNNDYLITVKSSVDEGVEAVKKLWDLNLPPDGIFSASDYAALGVCQELRKKKIKIPNDVAIIGFSNEPFTQYMELPISTIDQTPDKMGKISAQVFLEHMNENFSGISIEKRVILDPEVYIRKSSKRK